MSAPARPPEGTHVAPPEPAAGGAAAADPLAPYLGALAEQFPSKEALLAQARAQTERQRRRKRTLRAAATLVVTAFAVLWADPAWRTEELQTALGEHGSATLADGSVVQLSAGTVLHVHSHLRSRRITLVRGEALFTVAHGWRPFVVQAPGATIRDIGTVFDVRAHGDGVQVTVLEGAVEIAPAGSGSGAAQRVGAGQAWRAAEAAGVGVIGALSPAEAARIAGWQQGKLVFDGTPLAEALAEVQRYRRAPIRVRDERAARMRVSGEYDIAGVEALIDALPMILPLRVERAADGSVQVASRR